MWTEQDVRDRNERVFGMTAEAPKPKRRKVTSEAEIARVCTQVLEHDGWRHLRTDPVSRRVWGKGFGEVGMADSMFIRYLYPASVAKLLGGRTQHSADLQARCQLLWVEWKREDGTAAPHQLQWRDRERNRGALTLIAGIDFDASVSGFVGWYNQSGLRRASLAAGDPEGK